MPPSSINALLEHRQQFLGYVQRRVSNAALAEHILQAAYLRALNQHNHAPSEETIVRWFYRVLRNAVIDQYRSNTTENKALELWARELELSTPNPQDEAEVCACLLKVVDQLTPAYKQILQAVELGEQPLTEFAQQHNISAVNAGVRAHRARTALRKQLLRCCGACAEHACIDCTCKQAHAR
jgi:RNA polymerase sigma factor (sigma-70 family)